METNSHSSLLLDDRIHMTTERLRNPLQLQLQRFGYKLNKDIRFYFAGFQLETRG